VGGRLLHEYRLPSASKRSDVEFTQARKLDVECFAVRNRWTDPDAGHGAAQRDRVLDERRRGSAVLASTIR
jgi:hypothetical protein